MGAWLQGLGYMLCDSRDEDEDLVWCRQPGNRGSNISVLSYCISKITSRYQHPVL